MKPPSLAVLLPAFALVAGAALGAPTETEVDVVVDMSSYGRRVAPPSPRHPAYYLPVVGGYVQRGAIIQGEPPPPEPEKIELTIAQELAKRGYLVMNAGHRPSIILSLFWGEMNPQTADFGIGDDSKQVRFNEGEEASLVAGMTFDKLDLASSDRRAVMRDIDQNRYFVMIFAWDYAYYAKTHRRRALWQAKMSLPSQGASLDEALPILVSAGGPLFGRETKYPVRTMVALPEGRVEVGPPTVVNGGKPGAPASAPAP